MNDQHPNGACDCPAQGQRQFRSVRSRLLGYARRFLAAIGGRRWCRWLWSLIWDAEFDSLLRDRQREAGGGQ